MECSETRAALFKDFDPDDPQDLNEELRAHLEGCASCSRLYDNLQEQAQLLRTLPRMPAPATLLRQVHSRIEKPSWITLLRKRIENLFRTRQFFQFAGLAATATLVIITAHVMLKGDALKQQSPAILPSPPAESRQAPHDNFAAGIPEKSTEEGSGILSEKNAPGQEQLSVTSPGVQVFSDLARQNEKPSILLKLKINRRSAREMEETARKSRSPHSLPAVPSNTQEMRSGAAVRTKPEGDLELQRDVFEVRRLILSSNGRILSGEESQSRATQRLLLAEIPRSNYSTFLDKLRGIGELSISEGNHPEGPPDTNIRVTIQF